MSLSCSTSNCPPSPTPPWARPVQTPNVQTLYADGNVSLTADPTYLEKAVSSPSAPVAITVPNGNFKGQYKRILIAGDKIATTERFNCAGTFAGYSSLFFDSVGFNAELFWDGKAWHVSGNVNTVP